MLRLLGFFLACVVLTRVLGALTGLWLFQGIFGFWITAILMSVAFERATTWLLRRRRLAARLTALGHVETAHNLGKRGSLRLAHGRARDAVSDLVQAVAGEPDVAEWRYRLGVARLATRDPAGAADALAAASELDEEHAYGAVQLRLAEARLALGEVEAALAALGTFDRNHGPSAESTYWRGRALAARGERDAANAAFQEAGRLARAAQGLQRQDARRWALRAWLARLGFAR